MKRRTAFTIIELLVVVSIIALLVGILLPAIGRARDSARTSLSMSNLRNMGVAHETYSSEWSEKQLTWSPEDLGQYSGPCAWEAANGDYPWIWLGWEGAGIWGFPVCDPQANYPPFGYPYDFSARNGWFRWPSAKAFHAYVSGKVYDKVFYAPKDRIVIDTIDEFGLFDAPGEFSVPPTNQIYEPSYCLSPAGSYNPEVLARPDDDTNGDGSFDGWTSPIGMAGSLRSPTAAQARYPDLKTRMLEHNWLQSPRPNMCNPGIQGIYENNCEPYYFLHGIESTPMTLFYDGHVEGMGMDQVVKDNLRQVDLVGFRLWCTDTPHGLNGYFVEAAYDFLQNESPHILTMEGIFGRDWFGGGT